VRQRSLGRHFPSGQGHNLVSFLGGQQFDNLAAEPTAGSGHRDPQGPLR
jgi:hypothetical protein